jgi:hypothetical protein
MPRWQAHRHGPQPLARSCRVLAPGGHEALPGRPGMSSSPARSLLNNRDAFTDVLSRAASCAGPATGDGFTGGRPPRGGSTDEARHQAGGAVVHSSGRSAGSSRPPPPPRSPPGSGPVARFTGGDGSSSSASVFGRVEEALRLASSAEAALQAHPPESTRSRDGGASHQVRLHSRLALAPACFAAVQGREGALKLTVTVQTPAAH